MLPNSRRLHLASSWPFLFSVSLSLSGSVSLFRQAMSLLLLEITNDARLLAVVQTGAELAPKAKAPAVVLSRDKTKSRVRTRERGNRLLLSYARLDQRRVFA